MRSRTTSNCTKLKIVRGSARRVVQPDKIISGIVITGQHSGSGLLAMTCNSLARSAMATCKGSWRSNRPMKA